MLRKLTQSDFFMAEVNKNNALLGRANKIISGMEPSAKILNGILYPEIKKKIIHARKEKSILDMGRAIEENRVLLFTIDDPSKKLPDLLPFMQYNRNIDGSSRDEVAVNITSYVRPYKDGTGVETYDISDISKIFSVVYPAYLSTSRFATTSIIDPDVLYDSAVLWAAMFNKVPFDVMGLHNPERLDCFSYFAIQFFLSYIAGATKSQVESMSKKFVKNKKNDMILMIEEKIEEKNINIFEGLIPFMQTMFNDEITDIKGIRVTNMENRMNVSYYISRFVMCFGSNALLALCTFPYFIYVIISASGKSKIVKDKAFDNVFSKYRREFNRLIGNLK